MRRYTRHQWIKMGLIYEKMMKIGGWLGCHQMPERSFHIHGYQFPLCARCTGIAAGYIIGALLLFWVRIPLLGCMICAAIMFFDWYMQYMCVLPSTNIRRLISGAVCGAGYVHFWVNIAIWVFWRIQQME